MNAQVDTQAAPAKPPSPFGRLVDVVKQYKELVTGVSGLIAAGALVLNYFATNAALARVECRLGNKITAADASAAIARAERELLEIDREVRDLHDLGPKKPSPKEREILEGKGMRLEKRRTKVDKMMDEREQELAKAN
ncbi:MAG: hypothetical protein JWQ76_3586, partial [Ramlibacter sp.]|nr:hypothetical protein [Ramlibacter sp.]